MCLEAVLRVLTEFGQVLIRIFLPQLSFSSSSLTDRSCWLSVDVGTLVKTFFPLPIVTKKVHFLTFGTIVALELGGILLPSRQASLLALRVAGVVAELVISGTAERVTIFPKIMGRTDQSVFIFEKGVAFSIQLGCPHVSGFQSLLDSDLTDETSAAYNEREHRNDTLVSGWGRNLNKLDQRVDHMSCRFHDERNHHRENDGSSWEL